MSNSMISDICGPHAPPKALINRQHLWTWTDVCSSFHDTLFFFLLISPFPLQLKLQIMVITLTSHDTNTMILLQMHGLGIYYCSTVD